MKAVGTPSIPERIEVESLPSESDAMTARVDASASTSPFQEFFRTEAATGALLVFCAAAALGIANSPWAGTYHRVWAMPIAVVSGEHALSLTLHQWIKSGRVR